MEPNKKYQPNIEPDIRPNLHVVQGGGESTPERANLSAARHLQAGEQAAGKNQFSVVRGGGETTPERANLSAVKNAEESRQGYWAGSSKSNSEKPKLTLKGNLKKAGPLGGIIAFVIGIPTLISILLSPALVLQQLAEAFTDEFNDQLAALDVRSTALLKKKYGSTITSGSCGTVTIRCKYQTIRENSGFAKRLNNAGVEIEGNKSIIPGRIKPTHFVFEGKRIAAKDLVNEARTNPALRKALRKGYDPVYAAFSDRNAADVRTRLGLKRSSDVTPSSDKKKMNEDLKKTASGENNIPADGKKITADEEGNYKDEAGNTYTKAQADSINNMIDESVGRGALADDIGKTVTKATLKGALTSTAFGAGAVDSACTFWTMIRMAGFAAKYYQQRQLIRYGYEFVKFAHKQKYGDATAEEVDFFASKLTSTNAAGQGALDSAGYKFAAYGDSFDPTSSESDTANIDKNNISDKDTEKLQLKNETSRYVNGQLVSKSLMAKIAGAITNGDSTTVDKVDETCKFTKSWKGQAIVFGLAAAGLVVGFFSGGTTVGAGAIAQGAVSVAMSVALAMIQPKLINMAKGEVIQGDENGNETGNAAASGLGAYNATTAPGRGLGVATQDTYQAYNALSTQVAAKYAEEERSSRNPFDPTSKHTFVGSILSTITPYLVKMQTVGSASLSIPSFISSRFASLGATTSADTDRYSQCDDPEYASRNLAADPFCNLRYAIPASDLNIDPDEVLDYMLKGGSGGPYITPEDPTPLGEYEEYVALCFNRESSIGDKFTDYTNGEAEGNGNAGDECIIGKGKDEERNRMFRLFYLDTSIDEGIENDFESVTAPQKEETFNTGSAMRVASFNLRGASHDGENGTPPWRGRIEKSLSVIKNNNLDVIAFQEFEPVQRQYLKTNLPSYAMSTEGKESDSIMWNTDKFKKVDEGSSPSQYFGRKGPISIREPWVKLEDVSTNQQFYVMSIHDPINRSGTNANTRYNNTLKHVETIKKLNQQAPVITLGDFNAGFVKSDGAGALSDAKTPYCVLTSGGLTNHVFDLAKKRKNTCPNPTNPNSKHLNIDHIFTTKEIEVDHAKTPYGIIDKGYSAGGNGSDHATLYSDLVIPSDGGGSSGDVAWPLEEKWWKSSSGDFLDAHNGAGTFTSPGTNGVAVDISAPGERAPVFAMVGGKVIKRPLGRSSRICTGNPNSNHNGGLMIESTVNGKKLLIAYAHGNNVTTSNTVKTGEKIMLLGNVGNSCGAHLHLDMSYDGKNICPQDAFLALDAGGKLDWANLASKAKLPCSRSR